MTDLTSLNNLIGGRWVPPSGAGTVDIVDPATEELVTSVPASSPRDADLAIAAAHREFHEGAWPRLTRRRRAEILRQFADGLNRHRDEITDVVIGQGGCTLKQAKGMQVSDPIEAMYHYADLAAGDLREEVHIAGGAFASTGPGVGHSVVLREPVGVVAAITPFNYPFMLNVHKTASALAAGCTVVLKPTEHTSLDAFLMAKIALEETDLPPGAFNVLLGGRADVGGALAGHRGVDHVSFTGSTETGKKVASAAAGTLKRTTLELGGKSANIIFADADLDAALAQDGGLAIRHAGQACAILSRLLVEDAIHDEVVQRMLDRAATVRVGSPRDPDTDMGPLVNAAQWTRVDRYVKLGIEEGATLALGGGRPSHLSTGYYFEPTVFTDVKSDMRIAQEEIFGPVVGVQRFVREEEAVRIANDTAYGLTGSVWSGSLERGLRVASQVRAGTLNVNGPGSRVFGLPYGGYKASGIGREFGMAGIKDFTQVKTLNYTVN